MSLKEARKQLLYAFDDGLISDEECLLLYDLNRSTNLDFPYEQYPLFDLDDMQNDECLAEFRFHKNDLPILAEVLRIPDQFILEQRSVVEGMEALCMLLKRLTYPCRYSDMMHRFGQQSLSVLCLATNRVVDFVYAAHHRRITDWNLAVLNPPALPIPYFPNKTPYIVGKANRVLGLIRRTFGSKDPVAVKTAYNVLVRPILEYACPVWNPHLVKHIHSIESIQRRATRLICGSVKSYSERLAELNWSTLELRRKYLCLVQLYKIIHGFSDVDYTRYIDLTGPTRTRRNHDFKIRPRAVRTNYFKFSFFNRYVNDWNSLPNSVMSASSLNAFKNRLLNYLCT